MRAFAKRIAGAPDGSLLIEGGSDESATSAGHPDRDASLAEAEEQGDEVPAAEHHREGHAATPAGLGFQVLPRPRPGSVEADGQARAAALATASFPNGDAGRLRGLIEVGGMTSFMIGDTEYLTGRIR